MMARSVLHLEANSLTEVDRGIVTVECSAEDLASSLQVWIRRPQVVNKRLLGAVVREESYPERTREMDPRIQNFQTVYFCQNLQSGVCSRRNPLTHHPDLLTWVWSL